MSEFEYLVEWRVRNIQLPEKEPEETYNQRIKDWTFSSLGLDKKTQEVYNFIDVKKIATLDDLTKFLNASTEVVQGYLDDLYSIGIIEKMGKAYYITDSLSSAIIRKLIPRITESLRVVALTESKARSASDNLLKLKGKAFGNVSDALPFLGDMKRKGINPMVKVIGVQSSSDETVEIEGPIIDLDYRNHYITMVSSSGEKIVVGGRQSNGVDLKAHSIIIKGE
ncbi:hypothetical protein JW865_00915 [Candidatus Bathyarchaeota archaeon]|nr:hypothetical protein [Candidatus Bathyarchaeota archaeon]